MAWYAFKGYNNGQAISASAFDGAELNALGMHGYATQQQAQANPNSVNFFQKVVVNAAIDDYNNARDISPTIANNPSSPTAPVKAAVNGAKTAAGAAKNAITGGGSSKGNGSCCLINIPVVGCVLTKTQARAMIAGIIIGGSTLVAFVGFALLAVEAMERSGAGQAAGKSLETVGAGLAFVPGLEPAGLAVGAAGSAARRGSSSASSSLARRRTARAQRQQSGPTTTSTTREPIESESGGTRTTTRTTRPAGRGRVHERTRIEERTPGSHPGTTHRRVTETEQRRRA